jgi:hypothetical protein
MSGRLTELEVRRRMLVLRSERLRNEFAADQRVVVEALGGLDRAFSTARGALRSIRSPLLLAGVGILVLRLIRGARPLRWVTRGLVWFSLLRRALPIIQIIVSLMRSRQRAR